MVRVFCIPHNRRPITCLWFEISYVHINEPPLHSARPQRPTHKALILGKIVQTWIKFVQMKAKHSLMKH